MDAHAKNYLAKNVRQIKRRTLWNLTINMPKITKNGVTRHFPYTKVGMEAAKKYRMSSDGKIKM
jgi:hypothetical protein